MGIFSNPFKSAAKTFTKLPGVSTGVNILAKAPGGQTATGLIGALPGGMGAIEGSGILKSPGAAGWAVNAGNSLTEPPRTDLNPPTFAPGQTAESYAAGGNNIRPTLTTPGATNPANPTNNPGTSVTPQTPYVDWSSGENASLWTQLKPYLDEWHKANPGITNKSDPRYQTLWDGLLRLSSGYTNGQTNTLTQGTTNQNALTNYGYGNQSWLQDSNLRNSILDQYYGVPQGAQQA